jgi:hypothetical protein
MSDEGIEELLKSLNKNQYQNNILLKSISSKVDFAFVWTESTNSYSELINRNLDKDYYPMKTYCSDYNSMYFIKDVEGEMGQYVAAVVDMKQDLHWFVVERCRKQGHLTRALNEVILPHLFLDRKEQRVTINEFQLGEETALKSEKVTLNVGFKPVKVLGKGNAKEYILLKKQVRPFVEFPNRHIMSNERLEILARRLEFLTTSINMLRSELEAGIGKSAKLKSLNVKLTPNILKEIWWESRDIPS